MLTITDVSFSYDSRPVFRGLSLSFGSHWTALAGANGTGKSTLVRLINGELSPDTGSISTDGTIAVCPQTSEEAPACFSDPEILNSGEFFSLLSKLEIGDDWIERWDTLSGGEKKRCVIADILIRRPGVLVLDEPANHIDQAAMKLLVNTLGGFTGMGIIISHNMAFLESLAVSTVLLTAEQGAPSRAFVFAAPPLAAFAEFEKEQGGKRERKAMLAAETRRIERAQKDAVREAAQDKEQRMSKRGLDPHDSNTREKINLARLSGRDKTGGKKAAALQTVFLKKETELRETDALGLRKTGAGLRGKKSARPVLLFLERGEIRAGGAYAIAHPDLEIKNDSRIVITGGNGSGKTSLLEYIVRNINAEGLSLWYLPQELSGDQRAAALEKLRALGEKDRGGVLSVVYRLGSEPEAVLGTHNLSPGEARKLCFAFAMLEGVSLILLDEPTNHMDAVSASALTGALGEFEGAAVIVTHDQVFAEKAGKTFWQIMRRGNAGFLSVST